MVLELRALVKFLETTRVVGSWKIKESCWNCLTIIPLTLLKSCFANAADETNQLSIYSNQDETWAIIWINQNVLHDIYLDFRLITQFFILKLFFSFAFRLRFLFC